MKQIKFLFLTLLLSTISSTLYATSWRYLSIPELVQSSNQIVVGIVEEDNGKTALRVSYVLKGDKVDELILTQTKIGFGDLVTPIGKKGIHFLRKGNEGYAPFHPSSYININELDSVKTAFKMFADPAPFLDLKQYPENKDIIFVLGELFSGWRITSKEIPSLEKSMSRFATRYYEETPWVTDLIITLECEADKKGIVTVTSAKPESPLADFFTPRLMIASNWSYVKSELKPQFSVSLNTNTPKNIGSATSTEALTYLRERLNSNDPEIVLKALDALAKIRDLPAVPQVITLLKHQDLQVQIRAIEFLGWSRSMLATKPLTEILDVNARKYPENHHFSDPAAIALKQIAPVESLPAIERAACFGVQRASEAISAIGRTESFGIMMVAAKREPKQCTFMLDTFYWLVRRSNKETEAWMSNTSWDADIAIAKLKLWSTWWDANGEDFKVIKSQQNAIADSKKKPSTK